MPSTDLEGKGNEGELIFGGVVVGGEGLLEAIFTSSVDGRDGSMSFIVRGIAGGYVTEFGFSKLYQGIMGDPGSSNDDSMGSMQEILFTEGMDRLSS